MITINSSTRQFNIPGADLVFGVEADSGSVVKEFQCPRYVGNNLDLTGCFIRMNYRNANGEVDSYLVPEVTVDGDNVVFGWELTPKVTMYKGNVSFVMCVTGPDTKVKWHTTLGRGQVLDGLEPDADLVENGTADVVAALIAMVEAQTVAVENKGAEWVRNVQNEGTDQILAVQTAGRNAETSAVAQIEAKGVNVRASIPNDYTALSEAVDSVVRGKAPGIVCSVEGSAVVVNDASDMAIQGLRIFGRSTQDGTPTPDAPVEIKSVVEPVVTVCGKNLCNMKAFSSMGSNGTSNTYDAEAHTITLNADPTSISGRYGSPVKVLPVGEKCTVSFDIRGTAGRIVKCGWDKNKTTITLTDTFKRYSSTMTITVKTEPISFYTELASLGGLRSGEYMQFANVQVEYGDGATEYAEYQTAQTLSSTHTLPGIPVTSGGNYTDSDGQQWICDEVDFSRGVYVQRISTELVVFSYGATYDRYEGTVAHYADAKYAEGSGIPVLSDILPYNKGASGGSNGIRISSSGTRMVIAYYNGEEITSATVSYPLAAPIETPLSETEIAAYRALHSNYPNTTVLNDSGAHMVVKYAADTKLYIDNKIAALIGG